jgi:hypothetical protein
MAEEMVSVPRSVIEEALAALERHDNANKEIIARWSRADAKGADDAFTQGRKEGYAQSIQLHSGIKDHATVIMVLRAGVV